MKYLLRIVIMLVICHLGFAGALLAAEDEFPKKSIELVVPYTPGGTTDIMARLLAKSLGSALNQPVIVVNKPGAGAMLGVDYVAKAKPDGYTLLLASSTPVVVSPLTNKAPYDPIKDLQAIAVVSKQSLAIYVSEQSTINSVSELAGYSKSQKNGMFYGTYGLGSLAQLAGLLLNEKAGTNLEHIAYKGSAPALVDVISGNTPVGIDMITPLIPQFQAGKIKILSILGPNKYPQLPGVPTISGTIPDFDISSWFGVIGPRGMPDKIIKLLNNEINKIVNTPEFEPNLERLAMEKYTMTTEDYTNLIRSDLARWKPLVQKAGLSPK